VRQVAQAADDALVLHCIDLLHYAVAAHLQLLLHQSVGWVSPIQATELDDVLGAVSLMEGIARVIGRTLMPR
jgi:hypothetical protein